MKTFVCMKNLKLDFHRNCNTVHSNSAPMDRAKPMTASSFTAAGRTSCGVCKVGGIATKRWSQLKIRNCVGGFCTRQLLMICKWSENFIQLKTHLIKFSVFSSNIKNIIFLILYCFSSFIPHDLTHIHHSFNLSFNIMFHCHDSTVSRETLNGKKNLGQLVPLQISVEFQVNGCSQESAGSTENCQELPGFNNTDSWSRAELR